MIALIMDIATMEHVSVEKDSLVLIVQFLLAQITVSLVDHVLTPPVFALQDGPISIAQLNYALMIATEMDIVPMEHVLAVPISVVLTAVSQVVLETVTQMEFA